MCLLCVSLIPQMKMIIALVVVALLLIIISEYRTKHMSTGDIRTMMPNFSFNVLSAFSLSVPVILRYR